MPPSCSGSSRATARSFRSTAFICRARSAHAALGPLQRHPRRRFRGRHHRLRRPRGNLDQRRARARHARAPCARATPIRSKSGAATTLVGGLYGVKLGRAFFGESMFSRDARCIEGRARLARRAAARSAISRLLDCQFMTEHLASLGAISVPRETYVALLSAALGGGAAVGASGDRRIGRSARPRARRPRPISSRSTGCSSLPEPPAPAGPAGYVISQLLGQTS